MTPFTIIVPCPECADNPILDLAKPCPVCRGESIRVSLRGLPEPLQRHDYVAVSAYSAGIRDGIRMARKLRERVPSTLYTSFAVMTP